MPLPGEEAVKVSQDTSGDVAFFFGAGASVNAGVPDTFDFVSKFVKSLSEEQQAYILDVINILQEWGGGKQNPKKNVDVELLLDSLQRLTDKDHDVLMPFLENSTLRLKNLDPKSILKLLQDFIKMKVIVEPEKIKYLDPLRGFIEIYHPLNIFSANYDTCIELFCSENKLSYKDGFDEAWNPEVFDTLNIDIRLFKIHGSVTWYQSDRGRFLKIPIKTEMSEIDLITKERAVGLMFYPAQKFVYVEPLFELLMKMKQYLVKCKTLFVVGYSFRDDHVRRICWDIAQKNKEFHIVLIGPSAWNTYQKRLKTYDGKTLSHLAGKVICLPYLFEKILPVLIGEFLPHINSSRVCVNGEESKEIAGYPVKWTECLVSTAEAGNIEELRRILEKVNIDQVDGHAYENKVLESVILGLFYATVHADNDMIHFFWKKFTETILSFPERIEIHVNPQQSQLSYTRNADRAVSPESIVTLSRRMHELLSIRRKWVVETKELSLFLNVLKDFIEAIGLWSKPIGFDDYISRRVTTNELKENLIKLKGHSSTTYGGENLQHPINLQVTEIEKRAIQDILGLYDKKFALLR